MGPAVGKMRAEPSILPLRIEGLGYAAGGERLLAGIDLVVRPGRRLVVLGPNGAGKSLLLRLCHGLIEPTEGRLIWALPERASRAQAMVFQRPVLLRRSTHANLDHALALAGLTRGQRRARARGGAGALRARPPRRAPSAAAFGG